MPNYPTKEQILASDPTRHFELEVLKGWKRGSWMTALKASRQDESQAFRLKAMALSNLSAMFCSVLNVERPDLNFGDRAKEKPHPTYDASTKTIDMDGSTSIISFLHELAHHLYEADELLACQWSVHLFMKAFPKAYAKLEWNGHRLMRPKGGDTE